MITQLDCIDQLTFHIDIWNEHYVAGWVIFLDEFDVTSITLAPKMTPTDKLPRFTFNEMKRIDVENAHDTDKCVGFELTSPNSQDLTKLDLYVKNQKLTYDHFLEISKNSTSTLKNDQARTYLGNILMHAVPSDRVLGSLIETQPKRRLNDDEFAIKIMNFLKSRGEKYFMEYLGFDRSLWATNINLQFKELYDIANTKNLEHFYNFFSVAHKKKATWGITQGDETYQTLNNSEKFAQERYIHQVIFRDRLVSLFEYLGCGAAECGDQNVFLSSTSDFEIIEKISQALRFSPEFPDPMGGMWRYAIQDQAYHMRDIYALYHAIKAQEILDTKRIHTATVCEIGGGFAQVPYYLFTLGKIKKFISIDLPPVLAMQAYNLKALFPDLKVGFGAENVNSLDICLISCFDLESDIFDLADLFINVDSFPEMGETIMSDYFQRISASQSIVFSSNHEAIGIHCLQPKVYDTAKNYMKRTSRNRSWVRKGYIEEVYESGL